MLTFRVTGSFAKTNKFLKTMPSLKERRMKIMEKYARQGIEALKANTPVDTGKTRASWSYSVFEDRVIFSNDNTSNGIPIVLFIQYGHANRRGGYISGIDFINPGLRSIFDKLSQECWKEVVDA